MDQSNHKKVIALAETDRGKEKVQLILEGQNEVLDPCYGIENGFNIVLIFLTTPLIV
tara:strand:+ start:681 stop:851 length:171 start_codon:yes stop_codon:yes gene_type:complete